MTSSLYWWMYVSRCSRPDCLDECVDDIVAVSRLRNHLLDVSGVLLATPLYFAQCLEGRRFVIEELMTSITRDERHTELVTLAFGPLPARRFAGWSLAYAGPSIYLEQAMAEPLREAAAYPSVAADKLLRVMTEFVGIGVQQ